MGAVAAPKAGTTLAAANAQPSLRHIRHTPQLFFTRINEKTRKSRTIKRATTRETRAIIWDRRGPIWDRLRQAAGTRPPGTVPTTSRPSPLRQAKLGRQSQADRQAKPGRQSQAGKARAAQRRLGAARQDGPPRNLVPPRGVGRLARNSSRRRRMERHRQARERISALMPGCCQRTSLRHRRAANFTQPHHNSRSRPPT
jgi:hypothetical protein